jgi:acyl carrier protein
MTDQEKIKFIEEYVLQIFKKNITLYPTDVLLDIGLDSLDVVELQLYYEEITSTEITNEATVCTIGDLMALMT